MSGWYQMWVASVVIVMVARSAAGQTAPAPDLETERWNWSAPTDGKVPVTTLLVHNDYGDIRARLAGAPQVEAWAVIQRLDPSGKALGVTVERRGPVVSLVVAYPAGRTQLDPAPSRTAMDRLDLTVFVPADVRLQAQTIRGIIEARGLASDVTAQTLDGEINLATTGTVEARSQGGAVTVFLQPRAQAPQWLPPSLLRSTTGAITLALPRIPLLDLRADAAAPASSELPVTRSSAAGRHRALLHAAGSAGLVLVHSDSGAVSLRRTP